MRRYILPLVFLLALVVAVGLAGTSAIVWSAESYSPAGQADGPPIIKHPVADRSGCLQCHGLKGAKALPSDHDGRGVETCLACHNPSGWADLGSAKPVEEAKKKGQEQPGDQKGTNANCLTCHGQRGATMSLVSGEVISTYVDGGSFAESVHGNKLACADCHKDISGYPHPKRETTTQRAYVSSGSAICSSCHQSADVEYQQSVHGTATAGGNAAAATCVDCHTSHAVKKASQITYRFSVCGECHQKVTASYEDSVHGKLVLSGKSDAATCVDCHTSSGATHALQKGSDPGSVSAPLNVAETCGRCHQKALETYSTTFHGKAMRLGVTQSAATCVDCHGAYGVQRVHGPEAPMDQARIAETCAKCHEGADSNFAAGWLGHEEASPNWFPLVFITERFLFYLMTSAVAFGIIHVELDVLRWLVSGRKQKRDKGAKDDNKDR